MTARSTTARFGVDAWFSDSLLLGVGYSAHELEADFVDGGVEGVYNLELSAAHPYVATHFDNGFLALSTGRGLGEVIIRTRNTGETEIRRDARTTSATPSATAAT